MCAEGKKSGHRKCRKLEGFFTLELFGALQAGLGRIFKKEAGWEKPEVSNKV